jgi:rhodanese-related sulfurtransferase
MDNLFSEISVFVVQHWLLVAAFVLALFVWLGFEFRLSLSGIPQLTPNDASLLINREEAMVVDVRDFMHFGKGHIQGAINIPIVDLAKGHGKLDQHKEKPVLLVCAQGNQALQAATTLKKQGITRLNILKGGMQAWLQEGFPVSRGMK